MNLKILLCLTLACISLAACTAPPTEKPVLIQRPPISDTLIKCAPKPANPCPITKIPAGPPAPKIVPRETMWSKFAGQFNPIQPEVIEKIKEENKPKVCTEKDRLRWEAMMVNWGEDCESKLKAVGGLLNKEAH